MKYIFLLLLLPIIGISQQTLPTGCFKQVNVPAEYTKEIQYIDVPAVTYAKPILVKVTKDIIVKEKAIEQYYEIGVNMELKHCSRIIPQQIETVTYELISGYETIILVPSQIIKKEKLIKVKDGYVATLACDVLLKN